MYHTMNPSFLLNIESQDSLPPSMDSSQQLLGDSYSYRWLIAALNDSSRSTAAVGCSFIELDPAFISTQRCASSGGDDNNFDLPDRAFSSGIALLLPPEAKAVSDELSKLRASSASSSPVFRTARSSPASWVSACSSPADQDSRRGENSKSGFGSTTPKKILRKYFCFLLMPLFKKVREFRLRSKNSVRSCKDSSARSSPRSSNALGSTEWCRSNADISISDAILHCKKSNGFRHQMEEN